jgi:serine protein kinase
MSKFDEIASAYDSNKFLVVNEEMSLADYVNKCYENPKLIRTAYQRIWDMINSKGSTVREKFRKNYTHYNFFDDADVPIFGLEETLDRLCRFIKAAAGQYGPEKRILLLHGPVGSSKSTILRLIKRQMELYSQTDEGAWYTYKWVNLPTGADGIYMKTNEESAMHEEPLKLLMPEIRNIIIKELNDTFHANEENSYSLVIEGDLDPRSKLFMNELMKLYKGDWKTVVEKHIRVVRKTYSEIERVGIATFAPKDEKSQDSADLVGDINYTRIAQFGSDSDPRSFSFDGEFCRANRGLIEMQEMLKLQVEFLYDLLGASQEKSIKPKKFPLINVDLAIFGHTNQAEYEKLKANPFMEALRDRTVKIDVPYLLEWDAELKVLQRDYGNDKVKQHIAPHTLEIAALFAILTRLVDDGNKKLTLVEKAELYNGKMLPGWTEDSIKEMKDKYPEEGLDYGVSARYVQDKIANCIANNLSYINPFMVLNELRDGLFNHTLITNKEMISRYMTCVELSIKKLDDILKAEVQKALVSDEEAIVRLCSNYIDNIMAYINRSKVKNPFTGKEESPNERLMRDIESKIDVPESGADDFRRSMAAFIGDLSVRDKKFKWDSNPQLKKALEKKLFQDCRDHIKMSALNTSGATVVDPELQAKIDAVKERMKKNYGYNEESARDVLDYVGSLFASGDLAED